MPDSILQKIVLKGLVEYSFLYFEESNTDTGL